MHPIAGYRLSTAQIKTETWGVERTGPRVFMILNKEYFPYTY